MTYEEFNNRLERQQALAEIRESTKLRLKIRKLEIELEHRRRMGRDRAYRRAATAQAISHGAAMAVQALLKT